MKYIHFVLMVIFLSGYLFLNSEANNMADKQKAISFLDDLIDNNSVVGFQYTILNQNGVIFEHYGGYSNLINGLRLNQNTTFNANSATKPFTAIAILQLAEQGKLSIDDKISKYLKFYPYDEEITIRQALCHMAGLPNPIPLSWIHLQEEHKNFNFSEFANNIIKKYNKLKSKPGTKYSYSNIGYLLLGLVIENVSGKSYEDYVRLNIIQRLNILERDLDFIIQDEKKHAHGYHKRFTLFNTILGFFIDRDKFTDGVAGKWITFKNLYVNGTSYGGLIGNSRGFSLFLKDLLSSNSILLFNDYKKELFAEQKDPKGKGTGMCLGWFTGRLNGHKYYAHAGGGGGYYCEIRLYPELNIASVIMFNRSGMKDERILDKIDRYFIEKKW